MKMLCTSCRSGFTLVEIAIVAALLALISAFALIDYRSSQPRYRLERATARLATDLSAARMKAISECLPVTVAFDTHGNYYTISSDSNTNGTIDASEIEIECLDDSVNMVIGGSCSQGVFSVNGSFSASVPFWLIQLDVDQEDEERLIYVLPNGQVRCTTNELSGNASMAYSI